MGFSAASYGALLAQLPPVRSSVPRVALLGDSRCWYAHGVSGAIVAQNNNGLALHLHMATGGRVEVPRELNFGFAGTTAPELATLTCQQLAAATTGGTGYHDVAVARAPGLTPAEAIAASEAELVIVLAGTNDRRNNMTADQTIAALSAILDKLRRKTVVIVAETPRGDAAVPAQAVTGTQLSHHLAVHRWVLGLRRANVWPVNAWPALADPASTGAFARTGMLRDGLHLGWLGNLTLAGEIAKVVNTLVPPATRYAASAADAFDAAVNRRGALNLNPMLVGTGGTIDMGTGGAISGDVAANWTLGGSALSGVTVAASLAMVNGQPRQRLVIGGTPTASGKVELRRALTSATLAQVADGDVLRASGGIDVAVGSSGYTAIYLSATGTALAGGATVFDTRCGTPDSAAHPSGGWGGFMAGEPVSLPARAGIGGGDYAQIKLRYMVELIAGMPVSLTLDLLPAALRKVVR